MKYKIENEIQKNPNTPRARNDKHEKIPNIALMANRMRTEELTWWQETPQLGITGQEEPVRPGATVFAKGKNFAIRLNLAECRR